MNPHDFLARQEGLERLLQLASNAAHELSWGLISSTKGWPDTAIGDVVDDSGNGLIHLMVSEGDLGLIKQILDFIGPIQMASPMIKLLSHRNSKGLRAIDLAIEEGRKDVFDALFLAGMKTGLWTFKTFWLVDRAASPSMEIDKENEFESDAGVCRLAQAVSQGKVNEEWLLHVADMLLDEGPLNAGEEFAVHRAIQLMAYKGLASRRSLLKLCSLRGLCEGFDDRTALLQLAVNTGNRQLVVDIVETHPKTRSLQVFVKVAGMAQLIGA